MQQTEQDPSVAAQVYLRSKGGDRSFGSALAWLMLIVGLSSPFAVQSEEAQPRQKPPEAVQAADSLAVDGALPGRTSRGLERSGPGGSSGPGLDALLQLPSSFRAKESPSVAGADEAEWRRRFVNAEREFASAQRELARIKRELDVVAEAGGASQWAVAPPGASSGADGLSTSPLSFKHREAMRRTRDELDAAERALRELKIEADLAGVPTAWRAAAAPGSTRGMHLRAP